MPMRLLVFGSVLMLLAGCTTVQIGSNFDLNTFASKVQHGVTTQAQVKGWLGAPTGTGVHVDTNGERFEEWTYYYGVGPLSNMRNADLKTLQVRFDRTGVVRGYSWSGGP